MSPDRVDLFVEGLVSRAHDIDRFIALYRAELSRLPADAVVPDDPALAGVAELDDLLRIVEDIWENVSGRTARLYEEVQSRLLADQVERELAAQGEKWTRYLKFADAAGIRVPSPVH